MGSSVTGTGARRLSARVKVLRSKVRSEQLKSSTYSLPPAGGSYMISLTTTSPRAGTISWNRIKVVWACTSTFPAASVRFCTVRVYSKLGVSGGSTASITTSSYGNSGTMTFRRPVTVMPSEIWNAFASRTTGSSKVTCTSVEETASAPRSTGGVSSATTVTVIVVSASTFPARSAMSRSVTS